MVAFVDEELVEPLLLVDQVQLVAEQDGIAVEDDADLVRMRIALDAWRRAELRRRGAAGESLPDVLVVVGEEEIDAPSLHERGDRAPAGEAAAPDRQPVMLEGVEGAQREIGRVLGQHNDIDETSALVVEGEEPADDLEGRALLQQVSLASALELGVGGDALVLEDRVLFLEVEERAGRDADDDGKIRRQIPVHEILRNVKRRLRAKTRRPRSSRR